MIPKPPPREGTLGFLYFPPFRVQGISIAGEITCLQIPELDLGFDIGSCPRAMLSSKFLAISHGHMDHVGALAYFCSQRQFQGMGTAKIVCDERIESDIRGMMSGFVNLERQKTPYEIIALKPEGEIEIKNNIFLRGFPTEHTCPSFGYSVYERRTKLKPELVDFPQEKLRELKDRGVEITRTLTVPRIAYLGDTQPGPHLVREDVRKAPIVICECTFFEPDHKDRAKIGMHLHVDDVAEWLGVLECEALVLVHVSRRTDLNFARKRFLQVCGPDKSQRVHFLMDFRSQRARYEAQLAEAEAHAAAMGRGRVAASPAHEQPVDSDD
ncbi:MAG: hypothetical protein KF787_06850 [Phycisphaeraceae bacterium]|nr:hypothetical protein [Phycisphaeraceae bacterium]